MGRDSRYGVERDSPSSPPFPARITPEALLLTGVLLVTALAYLRCLRNGFVYDDDWLIVNNRYLVQWSFLWKSLIKGQYWFMDPQQHPAIARYRPLLPIWFALNYHLFGLKPLGWHAAMVAAHLLVVWLVYKTASRLSGDRYAGLLSALLFGLLAVHAEAVVWAAGFGLVMSAGFELGAFYLVMGRAGAWRRNWMLALGLYAGALLSHETAVTFPGIVAAYVFLLEPPRAAPAKSGFGPRVCRASLCMAPLAFEVLLYLVARRQVLGFFISDPAVPTNHATLAQLLMTLPAVLATYLALLVVPWWSGPTHRVLLVRSPLSPDFYLPLAALAAIGCGFVLAVRKSPKRRLYLFCSSWIAISIALLMDLRALRVEQFVHDNYLYPASFGWCLIVADWVLAMARRGDLARRLALSGVGVAALVCTVALWHVQALWYDEVALFTYAATRFPEAAMYRDWLEFLKEDSKLQAALRLDPGNAANLYSLGHVHARLGRPAEAASEMARALELMPHPPADAYVELAQLYDAQDEKGRSQAVLKQMESMPAGAEAAGMARARIRASHSDAAGAEKIMRDLTGRYPGDQRVWTMLGLLLADHGRDKEALNAYQRAIVLAPNDERPHFFAALALHALGRDREALDQCRRALAIDPAYYDATALMAEIKDGSAPN